MSGELNWAALAIPIFLGATLAEAAIARRQGKRVYAFGTAISDLACGSVYMAVELVFKLLTLAAYAWLFEHYRFIDFAEGSWMPWVIGMVGIDFLFYWWHRVSHVVNVMWAVHGVHHQSEDYNLAVALRQPVFEPLTWFLFYFPLALLGVSPLVYLLSYAVNRFYQFWIHTELVDRGPQPVEAVLNTPSHHRVHHGVQEKYLDKNYGAILILWDRLFGTFEPEQEHPVYGTTVPLRNYSPVWANLQHLHRCWTLAKLARRWQDKLWVWFAHPAWLPQGVTDPAHKPDRDAYEKYQPSVPKSVRTYVVTHFALIGAAMGIIVFFEHAFTPLELIAAATVLVAGFASIVGLVEAKPWAGILEVVRVVAFVGLTGFLLRLHGPLSEGWATAATLLIGTICALTFPLLRAPPARPEG